MPPKLDDYKPADTSELQTAITTLVSKLGSMEMAILDIRQ